MVGERLKASEKARAVLRATLSRMVAHPLVCLAVALALTAVLGWLGSGLEIRTNLRDLFPQDTPHVIRALEAKRKFPGSSMVLVVVTSPQREANISFLTALRDKLSGSEDIDSIELKHGMKFFRKNALLFLDRDDLLAVDRKLDRAIKKAVAKDLGPFGEDEVGGIEEADDFDDDPFDSLDEEPEDSLEEGGDTRPAEPEAGEDDASFELLDEGEVARKYGVSSLSEYFTNPDGTVMGMKIYPSFGPASVKRSEGLLHRLQQYAEDLDPLQFHPEMKWALEGDYHRKIEEIGVIHTDLARASAFALAVILVLVILFFGSLRAVVFVFVPLLSGIAWTMGVAWLAVGYLNLITAFIFALMFGLGVDFAVHATARYFEERRKGLEVADAVVEGLMHLGRPMLSAAATTTVTFLSLLLFDFRGFSHFGLIAGLGVPLCLLVVYLYLPCVVVLADKVVREKPPRARPLRQVGSALFGSRLRSGIVIACCFGCAAVAAPFVLDVRFEHDMANVMTRRAEQKRDEVVDRWRAEVESRSASPILLLTDSLEETKRVQDYLIRYQAHFARLQTTSSIFKFIPEDQEEKLKIVRQMKHRLDRKMGALEGEDLKGAEKVQEFLEPEAFGVSDLPDWVKQRFTDSDGELGHFVLLFARGYKSNAWTVGEILEQMDTITVDGKTYYTSASYYILRDAYDIIHDEGPLAVALAGFAVLLFLIIDLRRLRDVLAAIIPLALGLFCLVGAMGFMGTKLNMFNMVVLPTVLGIGIDTSIHLLHRLRQGGRASVGLAANATGSAAGMSAATTAAGFGSFALASNPGLVSIGTLAPLGITLCFLASVLLTCALGYLWTGEKKPTGDGDTL